MTALKRKLYKTGNSYTITIPVQILWDIDSDKAHNVVFTFDKPKRKWYIEFEESNNEAL
jgi:hypothetical protein